MDNTSWKLLRIKPETHNKLKLRAAQEGLSMGETIDKLLGAEKTLANTDEADALIDRLDYQNEHPESTLSPEDRKLLEGLAPGELPECCQRIYDDPEHIDMSLACHWEKAYVNHYGNRVWHLRNKLTGGSYFDYFNKYVGA